MYRTLKICRFQQEEITRLQRGLENQRYLSMRGDFTQSVVTVSGKTILNNSNIFLF